jgi:hypothetical protein
MKALMTTAAAATLMLSAPLALADGRGDDRRGNWGHGYHQGPGYGHKHGHYKRWHGPPRVVHHYYPAPRVVHRPVYVPAPVAVPAPYPYPYPQYPASSVDIGFRIFF